MTDPEPDPPTALPARYKGFVITSTGDAVFQQWLADYNTCSCSDTTTQFIANVLEEE